MQLDTIIAREVVAAVKALYDIDTTADQVQTQATRREFEGNITVVVFPYVKAARKAPEAVANEIGAYLAEHSEAVAGYNAVKGFLNIVIAPTFWDKVLASIEATPDFGIKAATADSPLVMIEYSSPNTNKPLHLGHVRNNLLGYSLAQILKACGNRVVKTNIVNDRGIHICKSMLAWQKWGNGATPESTGKKGDHLIGDFYVLFDKHYKEEVKTLIEKGMSEDEAKNQAPLMLEAREMLRRWEAKDPEVRRLWKMMNDWVYAGFDETYKMMGVNFDKMLPCRYYRAYSKFTFTENAFALSKGLCRDGIGIEKRIQFGLDFVTKWAQELNIELAFFVAQKMRYNVMRPYRNGKQY